MILAERSSLIFEDGHKTPTVNIPGPDSHRSTACQSRLSIKARRHAPHLSQMGREIGGAVRISAHINKFADGEFGWLI
jgi:hypothetical protein